MAQTRRLQGNQRRVVAWDHNQQEVFNQRRRQGNQRRVVARDHNHQEVFNKQGVFITDLKKKDNLKAIVFRNFNFKWKRIVKLNLLYESLRSFNEPTEQTKFRRLIILMPFICLVSF